MPKATAVWLVDNTALTFDQIAVFCGLHPLEVKGIANGDVAQGIKGLDPISNGQLTRAELERCQEDPSAYLEIAESKRDIPAAKPRKGARYTPLSKRQERPDAIAWLVRNHPELKDAEIGRPSLPFKAFASAHIGIWVKLRRSIRSHLVCVRRLISTIMSPKRPAAKSVV
jgi:hypothetical protein